MAVESYFVPPEKADLEDLELVIGVFIGGKTSACPVRLLSRHGVIPVTWYPLSFTAIVNKREIDGDGLNYRASGYLLIDNLT